MRKMQLLISVLLLGFLLVACGPQATPAPQLPAPTAPSAPAPAPAAGAPAATGKAAWQTEWDRVLTEAKKEGKFVLGAALAFEARQALVKAFTDTYGIQVEAITGRSAEVNAKILAERRAGLFFWDAYMGGTTTAYTDWEPAGALEPMDSLLIFPEYTDPALVKKTWYRGELWWVDNTHLVLAPLMFPHPPLAVNTTMVNPADIKSYNDFLDPKWKGKMSINDPTQPGTTFSSFIIYAFGADWLRKLVKQEPIIVGDQRLQVDWLAHAKQPIALGLKVEEYTRFKAMGTPIQQVVPAEGTWLSTDSTAFHSFSKRPHPNATKVFLNWLLSKEAQLILAKAVGGQSAREDVPTDSLTPDQIRQPGVKYFEKERKEISLRKADEFKLCKEIFAPLIK